MKLISQTCLSSNAVRFFLFIYSYTGFEIFMFICIDKGKRGREINQSDLFLKVAL